MANEAHSQPRRKYKPRQGPNAPPKDRPKNPLMIPFKEAYRLLKHLPGYYTEAAARERVREELPFEKVGGRGDIWVLGPAVHEKIGTGKDATNLTEDQRLIRHYEEDPSNNYVSATKAGLASTLGHAKRVYEEYINSQTDPRLVAARARKAHDESLAKQELGCPECVRTYQSSREDSRRVAREVTGDRDLFTLREEYALVELQDYRCPKCRQWRIPVPIEQMRECLRAMSAPAPEPPQPIEPTKTSEKPAESATENNMQTTSEIE